MAYKKPQYPLKNGENYIYPITSVDQVVKSDGSRLGFGDGTLNVTASEIGAAPSSHNQSSGTITTGGSEGQICVVNANGTISPSTRTIASLGTNATYSLSGSTLTITTL